MPACLQARQDSQAVRPHITSDAASAMTKRGRQGLVRTPSLCAATCSKQVPKSLKSLLSFIMECGFLNVEFIEHTYRSPLISFGRVRLCVAYVAKKTYLCILKQMEQ